MWSLTKPWSRVWSIAVASDGMGVAPEETSTLERRAASGDRDALAELLRIHAPTLIRFAATFVGPNEAQDMAQLALERIVKKLGHFDPSRGSFKTWAIAITRNACLDHLRRRHEQLMGDDRLPETADPRFNANPERSLAVKQRLTSLDDALQDLPEGMRSALTLFHLEDESYDAIATILEVPRGTVMTWIHRGRAQIKRSMSEGQT